MFFNLFLTGIVKFISKKVFLFICGFMAEEKIADLLESINKKLTILINNQIEDGDQKIREKVSYLSKFDLDYTSIAEILCISKSHAAKELSKIKSKGDKK